MASPQRSSGMALFLVLGIISVLAMLVSEFMIQSQVTQQIAYGNFDRLRAHYTAKSALKVSLLRIKGFGLLNNKLRDIAPPRQIAQIWSFPFIFPIPTEAIPVMARDNINAFQKSTHLEGSFTSQIQSESAKYNLSTLLEPSQRLGASPTPNPSASPFNPESAITEFGTVLQSAFRQESLSNPDFADAHRDFNLTLFVDGILAWSDQKHIRSGSPERDPVIMKKAPFYDISELHMLPQMDDEIFDLISPIISMQPNAPINVNAIKKGTLMSLFPEMTPEDATAFFKFRDATEIDNSFKKADAFTNYLKNNVGLYIRSPTLFDDRIAAITGAGITFSTEEASFRILVRAEVGSSAQHIEAFVTLNKDSTLRVSSIRFW